MASTADRYISPGGRTADYGQKELTDDLMVAGSFLVWAEEDGAMFGAVRASDAYRAMMRLLDVDPIQFRKIMRGEPVRPSRPAHTQTDRG